MKKCKSALTPCSAVTEAAPVPAALMLDVCQRPDGCRGRLRHELPEAAALIVRIRCFLLPHKKAYARQDYEFIEILGLLQERLHWLRRGCAMKSGACYG